MDKYNKVRDILGHQRFELISNKAIRTDHVRGVYQLHKLEKAMEKTIKVIEPLGEGIVEIRFY